MDDYTLTLNMLVNMYSAKDEKKRFVFLRFHKE